MEQTNLSSQSVVEKIPLGYLFYILSSGFTYFCFLPYALFDINLLGSLSDTVYFVAGFQFLATEFSPFANVLYFKTDNIIVITKIIFIIVLIGLFFLLTKGVFSTVNCVISSKLFKNEENKKTPEQNEEAKIFSIKFAYWARRKGVKPYTDFISSINQITLGLLYASEFLIITLLVSLVSILFLENAKLGSWCNMFVISIFLFLISIFFYRYNKKINGDELKIIHKMFNEPDHREEFDKY